MVTHGRVDLLAHPLSQKYLELKWNIYGKYFNLAYMLLYSIFLTVVTFFAVMTNNLKYHGSLNQTAYSMRVNESKMLNHTVSMPPCHFSLREQMCSSWLIRIFRFYVPIVWRNYRISKNPGYGVISLVHFSLCRRKCNPRINSILSTKLGVPSRTYKYHLRTSVYFYNYSCSFHIIESFYNNSASVLRFNDSLPVMVHFLTQLTKVNSCMTNIDQGWQASNKL